MAAQRTIRGIIPAQIIIAPTLLGMLAVEIYTKVQCDMAVAF